MALFTVETYFFIGAVDVSVVSHTFFSTLLVYNVLRLARLPEIKDASAMGAWMDEHKGVVIGITALAALGTAVTFFYLSVSAMILTVMAGMVSFWYGIRPLRGITDLRSIPVIKIFLIAISYGVVVVLLPVVNEVGWDFLRPDATVHAVSDLSFILTWMMCVITFILAVTLPFDIRDMHYDKKARLKTLPTVLGIVPAKVVAVLACLPTCLVWAVMAWFKTDESGVLSIAPVLLLAVCTILAILGSRPKGSDLYYAYVVEGAMLLHFGVAWWLFA